MTIDPLTIGMFVVLAVLIFFTFRNNKKRKQQAEELKTQIVPGVEVMTNFGLFGTLVSVDEITNVAEIETTPGTIVRVHRQTLAKVVTPTEETDGPRSVEEAMEIATREAEQRELELNTDNAIPLGEPEFGERIEEAEKKPARKSAKKASE